MPATIERVGRGGFRGSPITVWCPACEDWVIEKGATCVWCEGAVEPRPKPARKWKQRKQSAAREAQARLARERKAEATDQMRRMFAEGKPMTAIAAATGVDRATVRRRLAR